MSADIHLHIARLVVDRAALEDFGVRGLHDDVIDRITHRLDGAGPEGETAADRKPAVSDAIATAVAERLAPRLDVRRASARRRR